jgi:hypothetical protein
MPREGIKWAHVGEQLIMFNPWDGVYRHFNSSAARIWGHIIRNSPIARIVEELHGLAGAPSKRQVKMAVAAIIRELRHHGYLVVAPDGAGQ